MFLLRGRLLEFWHDLSDILTRWLPATSSLRRIWGGVVVIGQGVVVVARPIGCSDGANKVMANSQTLNLPEQSRSFNTSCDF